MCMCIYIYNDLCIAVFVCVFLYVFVGILHGLLYIYIYYTTILHRPLVHKFMQEFYYQ